MAGDEKFVEMYQAKKKSAADAIAMIQPHQNVFIAPFCNEPQTLVEELVRQSGRLEDVYLYNMPIGSACLYAGSDHIHSFKIRTFLSSPLFKVSYTTGDCDYIPINLSEIPRWIAEHQIDVALIQVSPPDEDGFCNLGISVDVVQSLIKHAVCIIAEVNNQMPWSEGNTLVHISSIDCVVSSTRPILEIKRKVPTEEEQAIGRHVASLIPDYSVIQVGVGSVSDSILQALQGKKGLGIHSGSITDPVIDLIKQGVITNEAKEINRYITICTTLTGTEELYSYANRNRAIELHPSDYTHNPAVISKLSHFHSINSALEVDLFGQVNAEQVGKYPVAGVGGQMDFIHGARLSKGGKAIIALPSTAKKGTESRIKAEIPFVTSLKSEIDYVVTEYGVAALFGKSLKERAHALLSIAHPDFREQLRGSIEHLG